MEWPAEIREIYLKGGRFNVGDGKIADFWRDQWCGVISLRDIFPELFNICNEQVGTVALFLQEGRDCHSGDG